MVFIPMPWEALDVRLEETVAHVGKLVSAQARRTGEERGEDYMKLSAVDRGNAALLLNRIPTPKFRMCVRWQSWGLPKTLAFKIGNIKLKSLCFEQIIF